ncbi:hypothetical protein B9Z55_026157 [Caenorhabditis nigoni]|uniref:Uncharacterized protein n=1 Tax=Caenorhabditis nigoni TaxID=1611254 RepID=A0A2G5T1V5_9PELO|nr:hypothetical protein B9Z55_026157 [Caenorhabditis nigoni]
MSWTTTVHTVNHVINRQQGCAGDNSVKAASYAINAVASKTTGEYDFVFVGPTCTTDIRTIGDFAEIWKSPVIGYEPVFEERGVQELTSVINVAQFSVGGVAETLVILMRELNQTEISLVGSVKVMPNGLSLANDIKAYNKIMNSFYIREYIELDENNADWTKIDYKLRHGARMIVICVDFYDIYSTLYNLAVRNLSGFRFIIVIILNKPPDEVLNQPNVRNLLYGANTFIISPRQEQFSDAFSSMQRVVPTLSDQHMKKTIGTLQEQFTQFLRIYQACYAYCVGSMYGVETQTDNYHVAMSGKIVSTKYGAFTFDKSGSVLTDYVVYTVNPAEMTFDPVLTLKSTPKDCDTYNCFTLNMDEELSAAHIIFAVIVCGIAITIGVIVLKKRQ